MTYPVGNYAGNNNVKISRVSNGEIQVNLSNMKNRDIGFIGNVTGSASVLLTTNSSNGTEYMFGSNGAQVDMHDASEGVSFWGSNISVNVTDNDNEANIEWNATNGSLSTLGTSKAITLAVGENAANNMFTMGWGDATIIDAGDYNATQLGSGSSYYASTKESRGALVYGGSGKAIYQIAGSYGVFKQGTGYADYQINGELADDSAYGFMNSILSYSSANIVDNGSHSLIVSNGSNSTILANGHKSLFAVGNRASVTLGENSYRDVVFAGGQTTWLDPENPDDGEYNFAQLLYQRGWTNIHGSGDDYTESWYADSHGAIPNLTGTTAQSLLSTWLTLGDSWHDQDPTVKY